MSLSHPAPRYTLEKLQEAYGLSIPQAVNVMEKFGSEKDQIDRFMRRCDQRRNRKGGGTKSQT
ncbi:hypothetical protein ACRQ1B_17725 [Rhizobium panacihumi]|uniref:hypothetical protein n=1 Tax=Rhizobium panacihumi TaxID=2008450 RepID=UPI003D7B2349